MLRLYNTESRSLDTFKSIKEGVAGMYTCGPTVYNYAHIGNLRTYVFEDVLKRVLIRRGYDVNHVMNITDVGHLTDDADDGDDKMEVGAKREGKSVWDIAQHYTDAFVADLEKLNIMEPNIWCKATDHIEEQIDMVKSLEEKGITYVLADGVYFDTSKFESYGKMAGLDIQGLMAGKRVEQTEGKRNPSDFCVWKLTAPGVKRLMEWDSPWGRGCPGWHLECSAMALKYLGDEFDIHCGGIDHVRVHHTNEIAQTEGVTGKKWVNWWMHGEFLLLDEKKMKKSGGEFLTVEVLERKGIDPLAYRMFLLNAHYRKALSFNFPALEAAQTALERLRGRAAAFVDVKAGKIIDSHINAFEEALDDDLNMPKALSHLWAMLQDTEASDEDKKATLDSMNEVLQLNPYQVKEEAEITDEQILDLIAQRNQARADKDFAKADQIRDNLLAQGVEIKDSPEGTKYIKK